MPPSFLYEPPGFTAGFTSNEADWEAGEWEHGRSLTSPCDNECGTATCAFFNSSFSCERLGSKMETSCSRRKAQARMAFLAGLGRSGGAKTP